MVTENDPLVGYWYQHLDKGQHFLVVAFDEEEELVEIQHFDGSIEEIDLDTWYELELAPAGEPENWSGAMDVENLDDLGTSVTDTDPEDWNAPLTEFRDSGGLQEFFGRDETENEWEEVQPEEEPLVEDYCY